MIKLIFIIKYEIKSRWLAFLRGDKVIYSKWYSL